MTFDGKSILIIQRRTGSAADHLPLWVRLTPILDLLNLRYKLHFLLPAQRHSRPASSRKVEPVIDRARDEARKTMAAATSSGSIQGSESRLPAGRSAIWRGVWPSSMARPSFMGVLTPVGQSAMTRMLCGASSIAQDLVRPTRPH